MDCEKVRDEMVLAAYGELPDSDAERLERHLSACLDCRREWDEIGRINDLLGCAPLTEPTPNLVAQSRMRLDETLDGLPGHGVLTRLRSDIFAWIGHLQSAPALATLLIGTGFLAGNLTYRYQVAHAPKPKDGSIVHILGPGGGITNISGIVQTPDPDVVQVSYNRVVPESVEGSLDNPQIRQLLILGTQAAATNDVRAASVSRLAGECLIGHACKPDDDGKTLRALLQSLSFDKNPSVRMEALKGLQPYVGTDHRVRDAIAETLLRDPSASVRTRAIMMLEPVQTDSSVRQVLRTVSTTDENPYIRTVSTQALEGAASIQ